MLIVPEINRCGVINYTVFIKNNVTKKRLKFSVGKKKEKESSIARKYACFKRTPPSDVVGAPIFVTVRNEDQVSTVCPPNLGATFELDPLQT
jgi:hypothetical protein